jgi:hypothetical protein
MLDMLVKGGTEDPELRRSTKVNKFFSRHEITKLVAYLFGDASKEQLASISAGMVGVIGKLVVLHRSLLDDVDSADSITKYALLDINPTCIPSNAQGLVSCAKQSACTPQTADVEDISAFYNINGKGTDFTSQIEPAWGYDPNVCLLVYRYKGRLVHKINPIHSEVSVLMSTDMRVGSDDPTPESQASRSIPSTHMKDRQAAQSTKTRASTNSRTSSSLNGSPTCHLRMLR